MSKPTTLREPRSNLAGEIISIGVSIGRGIFQKYFPPTVFQKFDRDYKLSQLIQELFADTPEAVQLLEREGTEMERKLNKRNTLAVLRGNSRVDFEEFIAEYLGVHSPAYRVFQEFLSRIQRYEDTEKEKVFQAIRSGQKLSEDDYLFVLELFAFERCSFGEFQELYKFIRNTQYVGPLILASLSSMQNPKYKRGLIDLVKKKGAPEEVIAAEKM